MPDVERLPARLREMATAVDNDRGHGKSLLTRWIREAASELDRLEAALARAEERLQMYEEPGWITPVQKVLQQREELARKDEALRRRCEYAVELLRSNQDTLLHKVTRNQAVREQLETNRVAIGEFNRAALAVGTAEKQHV